MSTAEGLLGAPEQVRARARFLDALTDYVIASVPPVTGRTLALARMSFGGCILYFWLRALRPDSLAEVATRGPEHVFIALLDQTGLMTALSANPSARTLIYWAVAALLMAFIAGAMTRVVYPALVCMFWLGAFLHNDGHETTPLLLALVATLPVPWARAGAWTLWSGGDRQRLSLRRRSTAMESGCLG